MQNSKKNNHNTTITIAIVITILVIIWGFNIFRWATNDVITRTTTMTKTISSNVTVQDGIQIITIDVGRGYSPQQSMAKSGIPTKIVFQWKNAYGCESAIRIPSLQFSKNIEPNGTDIADIGNQIPNASITILCSMGMYSANVEFI